MQTKTPRHAEQSVTGREDVQPLIFKSGSLRKGYQSLSSWLDS
jgi:hypothetical protein